MAKDAMKNRGTAVIVMGVSGSGKSTVGLGLADRLGCPYLEGDAFHQSASIEKMAAGIALSDDDRWPWLLRLSSEIEKRIDEHRYVVGSCSALKRKYRDRLRQTINAPVIFIYLVADIPSLESRMSSRPSHYMPTSLLQSQLQSLEPPDRDENALILTNETDIASVVSVAHNWVLSCQRPASAF
jgi:gluconokinase